MYDIIVIGAGPAGLTAALYALRADKTVLVLEKATFGGQITFSPQIENYPGFAKMSGNEFADKLVDQVISQGADIEMETVTGIRDNGDTKTVITEDGEHEAKAVIIATGVKHRQTGLPNENELVGEGISYCAVCDGAFFKGQTVAVLGGGNSALQEAVLLSEGCEKVYVIQNLDYFTGEARLVEKLKEKDNVEFIMGTVISSLNGDGSLESLTLRKEADASESELKVNGLFVAIGLIPNNSMFADIAGLDEWGYIDSDESCLTKTEGVFVAGDCRKKQIRQITTAAADGSVAALAACRYIDSK
ncbi:MAG: FAD-dependent oxidoreductase [Clostridia bacterium]|nr:FAD-dependent oxidoreductase [Clostridia bacterium]MBQ4603423.1 FAD-dependent oxidoreductase [Clostridia bacterium]